MDNNIESMRSAVTVTELNGHIKQALDGDRFLSDIFVKGEISNFKRHSTGHFYFSLKDEESLLRAVMFRSSAAKLPFVPENGMKVIAHGRVSSFVRDGQYQLYSDSMEPDGIGALYIAYEQLKRKLESEGLFSESRKKPLPKIPARIGIITSPTGAAIRDMINVTGRRFPYAKVILYPALVQGPDAPADLIKGVKYFNSADVADVIIIGRGGGSMEDLWAFNNERLAYAIAESRVPVISAVGHETDFTICDFVSDRRAPTPSAAAEIAAPDTEELKNKFFNVIKHEAIAVSRLISSVRERVNLCAASPMLRDPKKYVDEKRMAAMMATERLISAESSAISRAKLSLGSCAAKLEALSPLGVMSRGYSVVKNLDGAVVGSVEKLIKGDGLTIRLSDGEAGVSVESVEPFEKNI